MTEVIYNPIANFQHINKLVKGNAGDPAQVIREVVSNASDAGAKNLTLVPLPYPEEWAGFIALDDGEGMTRPAEIVNGEQVDGKIGFMGLGSKLLWDANRRLLVVTKTSLDDTFACIDIADPSNHAGPHKLQFIRKADVEGVVWGGQNTGMILVRDEAMDGDRVAAFKARVFKPWLEETAKTGGHGTLLFVQGMIHGSFPELLKNWDNAIGEEDQPGYERRKGVNAAQGDDCIELKTYLRFKTAAGHVLIKENLIEKGGISESAIAQVNREYGNKIKDKNDVLTVHYLTQGSSRPSQGRKIPAWNLPSNQRFRLKTLPKGYPYLKYEEHDGRDSRPSTITQWNNASFQSRFLTGFKCGSMDYVLLFSVDGIWLRNAHFTMLDRSGNGGRRNHTLGGNMETSVGGQSGILLSSKGVPIVQFNQLLNEEGLGKFKDLASLKHHFTIIIEGNFPPILDRTTITIKAQNTLYSSNFIKSLKQAFERAETQCDVFAELVQRASQQTSSAQTEVDRSSWETKTGTILGQQRIVVECPLIDSKKNTHGASSSTSNQASTKFYFISPSLGQEATVQSMYCILTGALTKYHFSEENGIAELAEWWPSILHCNNGQGLDAIGLRRRDLASAKSESDIHFERIRGGLPKDILETVEFKVCFAVSNNEEKSDYNHLLFLTDNIICWDLSIKDMDAPFTLENEEEIVVSDDHGHSGKVVTEYVNPMNAEETIRIPKALEGHAFFIVDILKDGHQPKQPTSRQEGHNVVRVVSLKQLIKATFNGLHPRMDRVKLYDPPTPSPKPAKRTPAKPSSQSGRGKRKKSNL